MRAGDRGFTLIELIAVLTLFGLLLAVSPMALDSLIPERELDKEVSRLAATIELLHNQAVLDRTPYAIHYDTEKHRWAIQAPEEVEVQGPYDEEPRRMLVLDEEIDLEDLDWRSLPPDVTLELYEGRRKIVRGSYAVTFRADGTVDPHSLVLESNQISSLDEADRARTVKVNFPGFVSLARGRVLEEFKLSEAEIGR